MADQKISELTALTGANVADDDAIAIVDTSATETKKIVFSELKNALDTATGFVRITGDTMTGALDVQSTITADGLTVDGNGTTNVISGGGANDVLAVKSTDNTSALSLVDTNGSAKILTQSDGRLRFYRDGDANSITSANSKLALSLEANGDISFYEDTGTTPKMVWKSADERLGIGTSSPIDKLNITGGGASIEGSVSGFTGGEVLLGNTTANTQSAISTVATGTPQMYFDHRGTSTGQWIWRSSSSERMRIDSSGNLLVGVTSAQPQSGTTAGTSFYGGSNAGLITAGRNGDVLRLNRLSTDGTIIDLRKDGAPVGSIGTAGSDLVMGTGASAIRFRDSTPELQPWNVTTNALVDGTIDIGASSRRFKDIYLSGGVVFGSTGGSVTSKTLDDYEEGTWTPSFNMSGGTTTYTVQSGWYRKVGSLVFIAVNIVASNTNNETLSDLSGLPFTVGSNAGFYPGPAVSNAYNVSLGSGASALGGYWMNGQTNFRFHSYGNNTGQRSPSVTANTTFEIRMQGFYST